jgi:hypothetical protein
MYFLPVFSRTDESLNHQLPHQPLAENRALKTIFPSTFERHTTPSSTAFLHSSFQPLFTLTRTPVSTAAAPTIHTSKSHTKQSRLCAVTRCKKINCHPFKGRLSPTCHSKQQQVDIHSCSILNKKNIAAQHYYLHRLLIGTQHGGSMRRTFTLLLGSASNTPFLTQQPSRVRKTQTTPR